MYSTLTGSVLLIKSGTMLSMKRIIHKNDTVRNLNYNTYFESENIIINPCHKASKADVCDFLHTFVKTKLISKQ